MPVLSTLSGTGARVTSIPSIITFTNLPIPSPTSSGIQASPTLILSLAVSSDATSPPENGESESSPNFIAAYIVLFTIPAIFITIAVIVHIRERRAEKAYNPDVELAEFRPHWFPWLSAVRETEGQFPGQGQVDTRAPSPNRRRPAAETGRWKWKVKDKVNSDTTYRGPPETAEEWQEFLRRGNPWVDNTRPRAQTQPATTPKKIGESSRSRTRSEPPTFSVPLPPTKFKNRAPSEPNAYAHLQLALPPRPSTPQSSRRPPRQSKSSSSPSLHDRSAKSAVTSPSRAQSAGEKSTGNRKRRHRAKLAPVPPNTPTTPRAASPGPGGEQGPREQLLQGITIPYKLVLVVGSENEDRDENDQVAQKTRDRKGKGKEVAAL
ncbi:hypothetical protein ACRALDRAFT_2028148 [Sodiomyces alcalophilus JCM 7366]|uniref:uncharacterized protein n=1 Tax=Sodiomyces alcalophilus JCM 7366 TaxID=591952 RepID=UPI0039B66DF4